MDVDKTRAILEEIMTHAITAGQRARAEAAGGSAHAQGQAFAYSDLIGLIQEQAALLNLTWEDPSLGTFDPVSLLATPERSD